MKQYAGQYIALTTYRRGGYFIIRVSNYKKYFVATKNSRTPHIEEGFMPEYEKKFETKEQANAYFMAIRKNNPDLEKILDEPNKYISYDGSVKEY